MADSTKKRGPGRPPGSKNKKKSTEEKLPQVPKSKEAQVREIQKRAKNESRLNDAIWAVAIFAMGVFFFFTIVTDTTGAMGSYIHDVCLGLFGIMAYVMPFYFIVYAVLLFMKKMQHIGKRTAVSSVVLFLDICILNSYRFIDSANLRFGFGDIADFYSEAINGDGGGAIGMELGNIIVKGIGMPGLIIFGIALLIICVLLLVRSPLSVAIEKMREKQDAKRIMAQLNTTDGEAVVEPVSPDNTGASARRTLSVLPIANTGNGGIFRKKSEIPSQDAPSVMPEATFDRDESVTEEKSKSYGLDGDIPTRSGYGLGDYAMSGAIPKVEAKKSEPVIQNTAAQVEIVPEPAIETPAERAETVKTPEPKIERKIETKAYKAPVKAYVVGDSDSDDDSDIEKDLDSGMNKAAQIGYKLPPAAFLKSPKGSGALLTDRQLQEKAMLLEKTFHDFGVAATVIKVTQGASVTRYEVQPATGVKVNKITALADDIALNMRAKSIRMEAPIPGKAAVGIEIENDKASPVLIKELIESDEFKNSKSKLTFVVGKDISGRNIVADLRGMPHMLIAGATGSGKSVCINTIITSILYKANPYEVKFIMIDPKVVELGNYNGIPHMSIPVVTDPKKAARALNWAVGEMNKRYEEFAKVRVKDLESYNDYARANHMEVKPEIVIIIDELADLMMAAPSQVEESICRLAQKARAAGMHLIVATQRPSVDIVTGVIKANIPSRIAFSVSSQFDSRTILDTSGAEKLLGKGDMLFYPVGSNKPLRVQGPFISDSETAAIIEYAKKQADPDYNEELETDLNAETDPKKGNASPDSDELTEDAIEFIIKSKQASVSMLQRRFRIGYNRAARIIDEIEERGIIGPSDGSRPRQVLVKPEEYFSEGEQIAEDYSDNDESSEHENAEPEITREPIEEI